MQKNHLKLTHPNQVTNEIHQSILISLRTTLDLLKKQEKDISNIRIRDWSFIMEEGNPVIDVFLDKGYNDQEITTSLCPRFANTLLTYEECAKIHEFILSTDILNSISDDVEIRFGTPGLEPCLRDKEDFEASLANVVSLETWKPIYERSKYLMILVDIYEKEGNSVAVLEEGSQRFEIPLTNIKAVITLPYHPASKTAKKTKDAARKKARENAQKKYKKL